MLRCTDGVDRVEKKRVVEGACSVVCFSCAAVWPESRVQVTVASELNSAARRTYGMPKFPQTTNPSPMLVTLGSHYGT